MTCSPDIGAFLSHLFKSLARRRCCPSQYHRPQRSLQPHLAACTVAQQLAGLSTGARLRKPREPRQPSSSASLCRKPLWEMPASATELASCSLASRESLHSSNCSLHVSLTVLRDRAEHQAHSLMAAHQRSSSAAVCSAVAEDQRLAQSKPGNGKTGNGKAGNGKAEHRLVRPISHCEVWFP